MDRQTHIVIIVQTQGPCNFIFGPVVQQKKGYLFHLWWPFCSAERNHLCHYGRGHYREQSFEIIFGPVVQKMAFIVFFLFLAHFVFGGAAPFVLFW